ESTHPVISLLEEQENIKNYGGTMRLGLSESLLVENTKIQAAYGCTTVREHHRHRYEVNNSYRQLLSEAGIVFSAFTAGNELIEACEWPDHPWGIGVQFHPEFRSSPLNPHPLFVKFIAASMENTQ
ncbi:MAG: glutamine amidotransferase-related protein, partial [Salinispira sp.]